MYKMIAKKCGLAFALIAAPGNIKFCGNVESLNMKLQFELARETRVPLWDILNIDGQNGRFLEKDQVDGLYVRKGRYDPDRRSEDVLTKFASSAAKDYRQGGGFEVKIKGRYHDGKIGRLAGFNCITLRFKVAIGSRQSGDYRNDESPLIKEYKSSKLEMVIRVRSVPLWSVLNIDGQNGRLLNEHQVSGFSVKLDQYGILMNEPENPSNEILSKFSRYAGRAYKNRRGHEVTIESAGHCKGVLAGFNSETLRFVVAIGSGSSRQFMEYRNYLLEMAIPYQGDVQEQQRDEKNHIATPSLNNVHEPDAYNALSIDSAENNALNVSETNSNEINDSEKTRNSKCTEIPHDYLCPILFTIMRDPVTAADGHTYERKAILEAFKHDSRSPMTRQSLKNTPLRDNQNLREAIEKYLKECSKSIEDFDEGGAGAATMTAEQEAAQEERANQHMEEWRQQSIQQDEEYARRLQEEVDREAEREAAGNGHNNDY